MMSDFLRFYPGFKSPQDVKRNLTREQFNALLDKAYKRPWDYTVMIEPKEEPF